MTIEIRLAETDSEISACWPVVHELRPHVDADRFVARVREQQRQGYRLAYVERDSQPVAVAGFRILENLAWGRFLYVDDLVTLASERSQGHGTALLKWLEEFGIAEGCGQLHLDSGVQRLDAHRFYEREGMEKTCLHFARAIGPNSTG